MNMVEMTPEIKISFLQIPTRTHYPTFGTFSSEDSHLNKLFYTNSIE